MKKTNLLLVACFAFAASLSALPFPDDFSFNGSIHGAVPGIPAEYEQQQGMAMSFEDEDDIMPMVGDGNSFDAIYEAISEDLEYKLGKLREASGTAQPYDGVPVFKAAYTKSAIYVFLKYQRNDDEDLNDGTNLEVMFCPYDKLEYDGEIPEGKEGVLWLRYLELGGVKVNALNKGSVSMFKLGNYMGAVNQPSGFLEFEKPVVPADGSSDVSYYEDYVTLASCGTSKVVKLALKLDFEAFTCRAGFFTDEIPFTLDAWRAACEGKGISFEVKLTLDNGGEQDAKRSYMWNHGNNNSYFNNAYAGYLAIPPIIVSEIAITNGVAHVDGSVVTKAEEGAAVTILSEERSGDGFNFAEWTSDNQDDLALLENVKDAVTTFIMPARAVAFTAAYSHISTEGAVVKNMSILDNQIALAQPADVEIINAATGIVVIKVSDETKVSLSGLTNGVYIVKSGNEVIKFAK